ncbi:MAG: bifunctional precorrin-2 dehydrogenase/sirohydrochlorin ferrochelatase [Halobacteria archaeon]
MQKLFPLILNFEDKKVVIFGGGKVGERKAKFFSKLARVSIVSREFTPSIKKMAKNGTVELIQVDLSRNNIEELEGLVKDAFLVIAATNDSKINDEVEEIANKYNKLLNKVDDPETQVLIPAIVKKGDIFIAISTLGKSPAMAKYLRKMLQQQITLKHARMVKLQTIIRSILKQKKGDQKSRGKILNSILKDREIWLALEKSYKKALDLALERYIEKY